MVDNPEYMLKFNIMLMSKNHNFFGQMDNYMKEFARITMGLNDPKISARLEKALNTEVVLTSDEGVDLVDSLNYHNKEHEIHHNLLAQPSF